LLVKNWIKINVKKNFGFWSEPQKSIVKYPTANKKKPKNHTEINAKDLSLDLSTDPCLMSHPIGSTCSE
jgi:hypothetical protein